MIKSLISSLYLKDHHKTDMFAFVVKIKVSLYYYAFYYRAKLLF